MSVSLYAHTLATSSDWEAIHSAEIAMSRTTPTNRCEAAILVRQAEAALRYARTGSGACWEDELRLALSALRNARKGLGKHETQMLSAIEMGVESLLDGTFPRSIVNNMHSLTLVALTFLKGSAVAAEEALGGYYGITTH